MFDSGSKPPADTVIEAKMAKKGTRGRTIDLTDAEYSELREVDGTAAASIRVMLAYFREVGAGDVRRGYRKLVNRHPGDSDEMDRIKVAAIARRIRNIRDDFHEDFEPWYSTVDLDALNASQLFLLRRALSKWCDGMYGYYSYNLRAACRIVAAEERKVRLAAIEGDDGF